MPSNGAYSFHHVCEIFPETDAAELQDLADDIKANGQQLPIIVFGNQIYDGRRRFKACELAGVTPKIHVRKTEPSIAEIVSLNLKRRDLSASQRAAIGAELLPMLREDAEKRIKARQFKTGKDNPKSRAANNGRGKITPAVEPTTNIEAEGRSAELAAEAVGVSDRTLKDAAIVKENNPELFDQVKAGDISASAAAKQVKEEQKTIEPTILKDPLGVPMPAYLLPVFDGLALFKEADSLCRKLQEVIEKLSINPAGAVFRRELETSGKSEAAIKHRHKSLQQIKSDLKLSRPYTRCPYCASRENGKAFKDCKQCRGMGWATKMTFGSAPADYRAAVEKVK